MTSILAIGLPAVAVLLWPKSGTARAHPFTVAGLRTNAMTIRALRPIVGATPTCAGLINQAVFP